MPNANRFIRIENYRRYQHYKERRPPWVKQHRDFWTDYDMCIQNPSTRLVALFLISYASEFPNELIPYNISELSRRSSVNRKVVERAIDNLVKASFLAITTKNDASRALAGRKQNARPLSTEVEVEVRAKALTPRRKDEVWEALVAECGEPATTSERGRYNQAAKQLRGVEATGDEVKRRAARYRAVWPDMELTPTGLAANWTRFSEPRKVQRQVRGTHGSSYVEEVV